MVMETNSTATVDINTLYSIVFYFLVATIIYTAGFIIGKYIEYRTALVYAITLKNSEGSVFLILEKLNDIIKFYAKEGLLKNIHNENPRKTAKKLVLKRSIRKHQPLILFFLFLIFFLLFFLRK